MSNIITNNSLLDIITNIDNYHSITHNPIPKA